MIKMYLERSPCGIRRFINWSLEIVLPREGACTKLQTVGSPFILPSKSELYINSVKQIYLVH